jgi:hypothetical protein
MIFKSKKIAYIRVFSEYWYKSDKYHRLNGPAIVSYVGNQFWFKNGKRIKLEDP